MEKTPSLYVSTSYVFPWNVQLDIGLDVPSYSAK